MRRGRPPHDDILTRREWEVLALIEEGLTNEQISARLGINVGTAKYHVREILSKLQVSSRWEAPGAARMRSTLPGRRARVLVVLQRLRPTWPVAVGVTTLLVLGLLATLVLHTPEAQDPLTGLGSTGNEGIGLDAGPSPAAGTASRQTPPMCVTGARAENPTQQGPSGGPPITMPMNERFSTVEEAEAWICLDVPQATLLPGWRIMGVTAHRSHSLSQFTQGMGYRRIDVVYIREPELLRVELSTPGDGEIAGAGGETRITVGGEPATLWTKEKVLTVQWKVDGVTVLATITPANSTSLQEAMPLLQSID